MAYRVPVSTMNATTAQLLHDHRDDLSWMLRRQPPPSIVGSIVEPVRLHMDTLEVLVERVTDVAALPRAVRAVNNFRWPTQDG